MTKKWVDNEFYFGPDRRHRDSGKRWGNKRVQNDAAEPPPLNAILRRLRVLLVDQVTPDNRRRGIQLAALAQTAAEKLQLLNCADTIRDAARLISNGDFAAADARIVEAQSISSSAPL